MLRNSLLSPHPDIYGDSPVRYLVDEIDNGFMTWKGIDLLKSLKEARRAVAQGVRFLRRGRNPDGRYDFRIRVVEERDGMILPRGTAKIFQFVLKDGRLRRVLANSGAL